MDFKEVVGDHFFAESFTGLFFLILIISGGYIDKLLPCRLQEVLTKSPILKHIVAIFTLYFFVNLSTPKIENPTTTIIKTLLMYGIFIVSRKLLFGYIIIIISSMFIIKFIHDYKMYHHYDGDTIKDDSIEKVKKINMIQKILVTIIVITLIIGFIRYTNVKRSEYTGVKWNWYSYLIDTKKDCASLRNKSLLKNIQYF